MSVLHRKLRREIGRSAGLLGAVAAIIAIGSACFVGLQTAYISLSAAQDAYYRQCRMADFWVELKKIPLADLRELLRVPGVAQSRARIQFSARVDLEGSDTPINARVLSLPEQRRPVINDIVLRQGVYFTARRENEVIINEAFARHHRLRPGDRIHLIVNNRRQELWIVGTALSSEFTYLLDTGALIPDPARFGVFYVKQGFAEEAFDMSGAANQVVGLLTGEGRDRQEAVLRQIESRLADYGVLAALPRRLQTSHQFLSNELAGLGAFATVTPCIFLVTAALVLNVFLGRLARQQRVVVGTLKAIGYGDVDIFWHFLLYGILVGTIGGCAGSLLGQLAAEGMTAVYRHYFEFPALISRWDATTHAIGITISVFAAVLGSLRAARRMLRLRPAEAMRAEPPRRGGAVVLERLPWLWHRLGSSWRMVLRNILRGRWRTVTTAFTALMGAALLTNGFMFVEAQGFLLRFQFEQVAHSDVDVTFTSERGEEAWDELRRAPGVERVEPLFDLACTFVHGPYRRLGAVTGLLPTAVLTTPRDARGRRVPLPETGLVLNRQLARRLHLEAGDTVVIEPVRGDRRPRQALVAQISDSFLGMAAHANIHYLHRLLGVSLSLTGAQLEVGGAPQTTTDLYRQLKWTPGIQAVQTRRETVEMLRRTLLQNQFVFIGVLVVFSGAVFFGSVLNASFVNLYERRREVASLRALGYTTAEIGSVFWKEALLVNCAGSVLGLPAGYGLVELTALSYDSDFFRLPVVWSSWIPLATLSLAVLFTWLAHLLVHRAIVRLPVREALNVRE